MRQNETMEPILILALLCVLLVCCFLFAEQKPQKPIWEKNSGTSDRWIPGQDLRSREGPIHLNDVIWLSKGWCIDLTNVADYPVIIVNYDAKECTVFKKSKNKRLYEIKNSGGYMVFSAKDGKVTCMNDRLLIVFPYDPGTDFL